MDNTVMRPYRLAAKDRAAHIWVDDGDKTILKVYRRLFKSTLTATLHYLIGVGARCFEEKHDQQIKRLEKTVRIQTFIIVKYLEKYGKLRLKD